MRPPNTVGYQGIDVPAGSSMRTVTFKPVGTAEFKLNDIVVTGADMTGDGDVYAQKINADGTWCDDMYFYTTEDGAGLTGWFLDAGASEPVSDAVTLKTGEAITITSDNSDLTFTVSGEVIKGVVTVNVPLGASMIGNPTPVAVALNSVVVTGADMTGDGDVYAQKINADGTWVDEMYFYTTEDGAGLTGWFLDAGASEPVNDSVMLQPGEAVSVTSDNSDLVFSFPAAL